MIWAKLRLPLSLGEGGVMYCCLQNPLCKSEGRCEEGTGTGHLERKPFSSQLVEGRAQAWGIRESSKEPYTGRIAALGNHNQLRTALEESSPL